MTTMMRPDAGPVIRVENLTARYGDVTVFDRVSFDVNRGEIFVILGGSGCGKSTMLKHMIGQYKPAAGRVLIDGEDVCAAEGSDYVRIVEKFGVMYQMGALFGSMTLIENIRLPLEEFTDLPPDAIDAIAASKLKMVGLAGFESYMPADISGGMAKRAAIARAMARDPQILFLDEPSAGLDPITSMVIAQMIARIGKEREQSGIVATNYLPLITKVAGRAVLLRDGRLIEVGPAASIASAGVSELGLGPEPGAAP